MATSLAGTLLLSKSARVGLVTRPLLLAACIFNMAAMVTNAAEIWEYMISQQRSSAALDSYTLADCIAPLFAGLTATACQAFMGMRCVRISGKSVPLCAIIVIGITSSLAGAVWLTVANCEYGTGAHREKSC